jgi:adenine-specific DNA-methyltransferase
MMRRRLLLAKRLLKPDGVLICTIDEWEIFNFGLLLEELFPSYERTTVVIVHNERGTKSNNFAFTHEYAIFMLPQGQSVIGKRMISESEQEEWKLRMWGANSRRQDRKGMFHPIFVEDGKVVGIGDVPEDKFHPKAAVRLQGNKMEFWPIDQKGIERRWRWSKELILSDTRRLSVKTVKGTPELFIRGEEAFYKTTWNDSRYDANSHGTRLLNDILGSTDFPFPKSLNAVQDCLRTVCENRPNAVILDFFAGSGTTYHATCRMNAEDGGRRQCILVTNNEVAEKTANSLTEKGIFPGQPKFEDHGICESVTWPRCKFVTNGRRDDGTVLPGKYLPDRQGNIRELKDGFAENIDYYRLTFLDRDAVAYGEEFEAIAPMLWLMAGARGELETARGYGKWFMPKQSPFGVLIQETAFTPFLRELESRPDVTHIFLVTDSEQSYREMLAKLPRKFTTRMLYKSYLENFRINTEGNL